MLPAADAYWQTFLLQCPINGCSENPNRKDTFAGSSFNRGVSSRTPVQVMIIGPEINPRLHADGTAGARRPIPWENKCAISLAAFRPRLFARFAQEVQQPRSYNVFFSRAASAGSNNCLRIVGSKNRSFAERNKQWPVFKSSKAKVNVPFEPVTVTRVSSNVFGSSLRLPAK